jgi:hypothetical protein
VVYSVYLHSLRSPVMLAVGLPRAVVSLGARDFPTAAAALLAGAAAAVGCGMLLDGTSWQKAAGAVLFAIGVALPVWLRRLGPAWRAGGTVAAIPFLAVLSIPSRTRPAGHFSAGCCLPPGPGRGAVVAAEGSRERVRRAISDRGGDVREAEFAGAQVVAGESHPPLREVLQRGLPERVPEDSRECARDRPLIAASSGTVHE